jgi:hypothetical protein
MPAECQALLEEWDAARSGALVPRRAEIDPAALRPLLPNLFILELLSPDEIRFRLAGTRYCDLVGFDATGMNFIDLAPAEDRRTRAYRNWSAVRRPCGTYFTVLRKFHTGTREFHYGLLLPVRPARDGGAPQLIGVLVSSSGRDRVNRAEEPVLTMPEIFEFVDIGAGVPASIHPPKSSIMS